MVSAQWRKFWQQAISVNIVLSRPKLNESDPLKIYITFNSKLEEFKRFGEEHGVPVIAGCPAASNFWELSIGSNFRWLQIGHHDLASYLFYGTFVQKVLDSFSAI